MHRNSNITGNLNSTFLAAGIFDFGHLQCADFQRLFSYKNALTFTGKEKDSETGFYYFGARYYDPALSGLFLSVDPMADKYPSISPYAYCAWNPVKLVDPDGRKWDPASKDIIDKFRQLTNEKMNNEETDKMKLKYKQVLDELDALALSSQVYHVEESLGRDGYTSYDLSNDWVCIQFDGKNNNLAHELKHAYQFEKGDLSFSSETGGWADIVCYENGQCKNRVLLYDLTDEVAAFQRGELYGGPSLTKDYIANRYSFEIEGSNRKCYPFLMKPLHGTDNIYLGCDTRMSLPHNANPDWDALKGNIFRLEGKTYKK